MASAATAAVSPRKLMGGCHALLLLMLATAAMAGVQAQQGGGIMPVTNAPAVGATPGQPQFELRNGRWMPRQPGDAVGGNNGNQNQPTQGQQQQQQQQQPQQQQKQQQQQQQPQQQQPQLPAPTNNNNMNNKNNANNNNNNNNALPGNTGAKAPGAQFQATQQQLLQSATLLTSFSRQLPQDSPASISTLEASQSLLNAYVLLQSNNAALALRQIGVAEDTLQGCTNVINKLNNEQWSNQLQQAATGASQAKAGLAAALVTQAAARKGRN